MIRTSSPGKAWNIPRAEGRAGFTLLEMVLVLVLAGLVAGLALPVLSATLERTKRNASVREITSALRYARSKAVSSKTPVAFKAQFEEQRFWLEDLRTGKKSPVKSLHREIRFREFNNGEGQREDGIASIVFYPRGNASGGALVLQGTRREEAEPLVEIRVDPVTGSPKVETYEE